MILTVENHSILALDVFDWEDYYFLVLQKSTASFVDLFGGNPEDLKHYPDIRSGIIDMIYSELTTFEQKQVNKLVEESSDNSLKSIYTFYQKLKMNLLEIHERMDLFLLEQSLLKELLLSKAKMSMQARIVFYNHVNKNTTTGNNYRYLPTRTNS